MRSRLTSKNKKTISRIAVLILLLLALVFIWGQSCAGAVASTGESRFVTERIVRPLVRNIAGENAAKKVTDPLVRKIAHVAEYTVLGVILGVLT